MISSNRRALVVAIALALSYAGCTGSSQTALEPDYPDYPPVTTIAGSGLAGIDDGNAARAKFLAPAALAFDKNGNVFVADAGAQRIREIETTGTVKTIAGGGNLTLFGTGVAGGYVDGPAATARFDTPSGIAVAPNGTIYVADTGNNCIRRIDTHGNVTTLAGSPGEAPPKDGRGNGAVFHSPRGLAFDGRGHLLVADVPNGIRQVDDAGNVRTLTFDGSQGALSLSTYHDAHTSELFVATATDLIVYDLDAKREIHRLHVELKYAGDSATEGREFVGPASAIAALGPSAFVYSDALFSTVRYVQMAPPKSDIVRDFAYSTPLDAQKIGGSFHDGNVSSSAAFDQPMGIAVNPSGRVVVADTGNRRIRSLAPFNQRAYNRDGDVLPKVQDLTKFRIAIVGSSLVWTDVGWHASIPGIVEHAIANDPSFKATGKRVEVYPIREGGAAVSTELEYADNYLTGGLFDVVVIAFTAPQGQYGTRTGEARLFEKWTPDLVKSMASVQGSMTQQHRAFLALYFPGALHFANESTWYQLVGPTLVLPEDPGRVQAYYSQVVSTLRAAKIDTLDLWPSMTDYEKRADHRPIAGSWDNHFTTQGYALIGNGLANRLLTEHPWKT